MSKECACNAGVKGLIPGSGTSPGEGNGNIVQYSCLGIRLWLYVALFTSLIIVNTCLLRFNLR